MVTLTAYRNPITNETATYDNDQIADIIDELADSGFEEIGKREVKKRRVYCGLMDGAEWLEEPKRIPGEHIPLIPVYGRRSFVDNMERIEGHAAKAMDAQLLENLMVSMIADNATQAGGDGIPIMDVDFIPTTLKSHWSERNKKRPAYLPMKSMRDNSGAVVAQAQVSGYTPPTQMPPALAGQQQQAPTQAPRMPQLSDDGIDYDESVFQKRLSEWSEENARYQTAQAQQQQAQLVAQQQYQQRLQQYQERVKTVKVPNYQQAEKLVIDEVPEAIQAAVIQYAEKPEMVVIALARNPELRKQFADATDPVALGRQIGIIESKAKTMPKPKSTAATVTPVKGSNGAELNSLEKLKEEAHKSGDWSAYFAAKCAKK